MARATLAEKVVDLGDLSRPDLINLWVKQYGVDPPLGVRQPMLVRAAAWHIQEKQLGGMSSSGKRLLKAALKQVCERANDVGSDPAAAFDDTLSGAAESVADLATTQPNRSGSCRAVPLPGARLIREWNGRRYMVEVVDGGFVMDGKPYRSLTAIAFRITGARWSGPRFFGL